ncbi:hypothetical protein HMPREF1981_02708 [Bacteroides pyogenes F0041]|uniref:Uncharacterized protein n=1 Tax=Bacteroides pyogenes F0041 TaxID=1321819 RepID=U2CDC2_9BACE|nr:hypothetical protein HMPREF1981_02708 [Bacteroides pyogenes F0041]GAE21671.1 hypothetical protein JCM10003_1155 [Bacteroides pyogenes JCM 10003]
MLASGFTLQPADTGGSLREKSPFTYIQPPQKQHAHELRNRFKTVRMRSVKTKRMNRLRTLV